MTFWRTTSPFTYLAPNESSLWVQRTFWKPSPMLLVLIVHCRGGGNGGKQFIQTTHTHIEGTSPHLTQWSPSLGWEGEERHITIPHNTITCTSSSTYVSLGEGGVGEGDKVGWDAVAPPQLPRDAPVSTVVQPVVPCTLVHLWD